MSKVRIFALGGLDEDGKNMYVIENNDDTCMANEEIESMPAALKGLIDDDIYEQSRKVPEPPFDVDAMVRSLDEYFYYTGEGKDRFDEWFDYSRA